MHTRNKFLFNSYLALLFWAPIPLGSNRPWAWAIIETIAFILLAIYLFSAIKNKENIWQRCHNYKPLIIIFSCVQCWVFIQTIPIPVAWLYSISPELSNIYTYLSPSFATLSLDSAQSTVALYKGLAYLCLILLTIFLVNSEIRFKNLLITMVASGTFQAIYGSLQSLSGNKKSWVFELANSSIATGGFIYKNHFANFLLLTISMGVGLLVAGLSNHKATTSKEFFRRIISVLIQGKAVIRISLALMVIGLVLSRSRMGNAAVFSAMAITGLFSLFFFKQKSKGLTILIVSLFVIDAFILGAWFGIDKVKTRLEQTNLMHETRDEVDIYGLELIEKYPLTGTGAGSFYATFPTVQRADVQLFYDHAHNDYLQFAIEFGLPATILLGIMILWSLWQTIYTMRQRHSNLMKGAAFGCMMAIIGMLIHISVDFNLQAPANTIYFLIILTLSWQTRFLCRHKIAHKRH